jgi:nucleotide-binding universal stress UspA family protein
VVISTAKETLTSASFIENFINHIDFVNGKIEVLRVLQNENDKAPKSIKLELKEIPVATVRNENAVDGINAFLEENEVDILCLYHSHSTRLDYLFNRSVTKTICAKVELPLLVMRGE